MPIHNIAGELIAAGPAIEGPGLDIVDYGADRAMAELEQIETLVARPIADRAAAVEA